MAAISSSESAATDAGLQAYRLQARTWLNQHVPRGWEETMVTTDRDGYVAFQRQWLRQLATVSYAAPHWPSEFGGGASIAEQVVLYEEMQRAGAPGLETFYVSLNHAAATIMGYGTERQKQHLPRILDGELWCQGFSEPDAGSDLASLRTRAERRGDRYIVNGQKVWSSFADLAARCLLLARTDPDAPKRSGISFFLLDMSSPGVETRPIHQITDETEFCEIVLDDVEIPLEDRVGAEGEGWTIARRTLASERGPGVLELQAGLRVAVTLLFRLAEETTTDGRTPAVQDDHVRDTLARAYSEAEILRLLCTKMVANLQRPQEVDPAASVIKLYYSELLQRLTDFGSQLDGLRSQIADGPGRKVKWAHWLLEHLASWQWTIGGGSNEIQRSLVAERVLGLPRDPLVS